jgi:SAM-dependent methyltransferase
MTKPKTYQADYGNWVPMRLLYILGFGTVIFLALSFIFLFSLIGATIFLVAFAYFAYARRKFSPRGGNVQAQIRELLLNRLDWTGEGKAIDIGCGNAPLTVSLAKKFPTAAVTGIDYWGGRWAYSKQICEKNAEFESVSNRVNFQKASASALPFDDEYFDAAVSNLVFHEVSDTKDKRDVIKEALRVVKKGGSFAFQDLFLVKGIYGEVDDLLVEIRSWGVETVAFVDTSHSAFIPKALRLPFMVGAIGVLYGKK